MASPWLEFFAPTALGEATQGAPGYIQGMQAGSKFQQQQALAALEQLQARMQMMQQTQKFPLEMQQLMQQLQQNQQLFPLNLQKEQLALKQSQEMAPLEQEEKRQKAAKEKAEAARNTELAGLYKSGGMFPAKSQKERVERLIAQGEWEHPEVINYLKGLSQSEQSKAEGKREGSTKTQMSRYAKELVAEEYLAGNRLSAANLGRGVQGADDLRDIKNIIAEKAAQRGMSAAQIAAKIGEFEGFKTAQRTFGARGANVEMAVAEADALVDPMLKASEKVSRTDAPIVNQNLMNVVQGLGLQGSEELQQFSIAINSFINVYSRALQPIGIPTDDTRKHARELIYRELSKGTFRKAVDQLYIEMDAAIRSPDTARDRFYKSFTGTARSTESTTPRVVKPPMAPAPSGGWKIEVEK